MQCFVLVSCILCSIFSMQGDTSLTSGMDTVFVRIPRHTDLQEYRCTISPTQGDGIAAYRNGLDQAVAIRVSVHDGMYVSPNTYCTVVVFFGQHFHLPDPIKSSFRSPCQLGLITFTHVHTNHTVPMM